MDNKKQPPLRLKAVQKDPLMKPQEINPDSLLQMNQVEGSTNEAAGNQSGQSNTNETVEGSTNEAAANQSGQSNTDGSTAEGSTNEAAGNQSGQSLPRHLQVPKEQIILQLNQAVILLMKVEEKESGGKTF